MHAVGVQRVRPAHVRGEAFITGEVVASAVALQPVVEWLGAVTQLARAHVDQFAQRSRHLFQTSGGRVLTGGKRRARAPLVL